MNMATDQGWVGTWRPHKPRGPIAAHYTSPGPKYALPGLTGTSNHDPTKFKAPTFSFGMRPSKTTADCSPGPIYHIASNLTRVGQDGTPAFSLHGRHKEPKIVQTPGPGTYSPNQSEKWIFRSAPAFSLTGRSKDLKSSQSPGPAAYSLPPMLAHNILVKSTAPSFSMYGRIKTGSFHEDMKKGPGPAAYKVVDQTIYSKKAPSYSMTGRNFPPGESTQNPGPGAHCPEKVTMTQGQAPRFTFGIRHSEHIYQAT